MDDSLVWSLLERGGAVRRGHYRVANGHAPLRLAKYDSLRDPQGAESLAVALADQMADAGADAVVVWDEAEDLVLAFMVASRLGCRVVRLFDDDGLVGHSLGLGAHQKVVMITDQVSDASTVYATQSLLESLGGSLERVGVLIDRGSVDGVQVMGLTRVLGEPYPPDDCPLCQDGVPVDELEPAGSSSHVNGRERY